MKKTKLFAIALAAMISMSACHSTDPNKDDLTDEDVATGFDRLLELEESEKAKKSEEAETTTKSEETQLTDEVIEPAAEDFDYEYDAVLKGVKITRYNGKETAIRVPNEINGDPVIGFRLFNQMVKYIELPDSMQNVSDNAFDIESGYASAGLSVEEVIIPDSITSIGSRAFYNCSALKSLKIPNNVVEICDSAFKKCKSLTEIKLPEGLTTIGTDAFGECTSLTEITIPSSVTKIGDCAFNNCGLEKVVISSGITSIGKEMFIYCGNLKEIIIPDSVTIIEDRAFSGCKNLREMTLPNNVTSIGEHTFDDCNALTVTYNGDEYNYSNWNDLYNAING
ncbi:MAG: leucine-rich repeat protein [Oscillospiraceae bacterium]